jgi:hypothetical protein
MKKDLIRLDELWKLKDPTVEEIKEFFKLSIKYPYIDSYEIITVTN